MSMTNVACRLAVFVAVGLGAIAQAEDLAKTVAVRLRDSGTLDGYRVKVRAKQGTVWLEGEVSDAKNIAAAVGLAESTAGVERVVNRLAVATASSGRTSNLALPRLAWDSAGIAPPVPQRPERAERSPEQEALTQQAGWSESPSQSEAGEQVQLTRGLLQQGQAPLRMAGVPRPMRQASMPVQPVGMRAMSQQEMVDGEQLVPGSMRVYEGPASGMPMEAGPAGGMPEMAMGTPRPMGAAGVGMPPVPMRGDGPNMPNYAWPSYASYPNYAALQYPTQYSPTAFPYIGPFYPYPQVPLGWRRVSLEWDDGWWYVDFDERHVHSHHR